MTIPLLFATIQEIGVAAARAIATHTDGTLGSANTHGDTQTSFDLMLDSLIRDAFRKTGVVSMIESEEQPDPVRVGDGRYTIAVDPVDGSKNSLINGNFGSLFGIYESNRIVAAAYILYGPRTILVTAHARVQEYLLEGDTFTLVEENVVLPTANIILPGGLADGYSADDHERFTTIMASNPYVVYNPALVANLHYVLKKGGVYLYPSTKKSPSGKIRLGYESKTIAFIMECAGGLATDGSVRILDRDDDARVKTPLYFGTKEVVGAHFLSRSADH